MVQSHAMRPGRLHRLDSELTFLIISAENMPVRFLLISGKPIGEPVAWQGPIVMNTQEELKIAFEEYRKGTFTKHKKNNSKGE